ncbi:MAG: hypothetical protein ACPHO9_09045 [Ilumatobacteraceae bacterium]
MGPYVLNRRIWVGSPPMELLRSQESLFRSASPDTGLDDRSTPLIHGTAPEVADRLASVAGSTGATHLGLKIHLPGMAQDQILDQIAALAEILPPVAAALKTSGDR